MYDQVGGIICTCTSGWKFSVYMYLKLVVLCVHVPQVGGIVCTCTYDQVGGIICTCTSGWKFSVYMYLMQVGGTAFDPIDYLLL